MAHTFIIAEIGCNHNGSVETAKRMIDQVAQAGCDAAKFQVFHADLLASCKAESAEYQKASMEPSETQLEMLRKLQLDEAQLEVLSNYCAQVGIEFFATPFDTEAVSFLEQLGVGRYKIGSGDITDQALVSAVARTGKPVILSTGMSTYEEIDGALEWLHAGTSGDISLLHCTSNYPTAYADVNMRVMDSLAKKYGLPIGYSDHTIGTEIPVMAVACGACIIEKHVTLDRNMPGPDHRASLELADLPHLVSMIRHVEQAFGQSEKGIQPSEVEIRHVARKSLVAACDLMAGDVVCREHLLVKRPGTGIEPKRLDDVVGRRLARNVKADMPLCDEDLA